MTTLSERVEGLAGPDREVADEVLRACGCTVAPKLRSRGGMRHSWRLPDGRHMPLSFDPTASIDAALSLLPDKTKWTIQSFGGPGPMALVDPNERFISGATPCLALLAAILKAREL